MSAAKHTGGEWYCRRGCGQMVSGDTTVAEIARAGDLASWWIFSDADEHGDPAADAQLMASAKRMHDALHRILALSPYSDDVNYAHAIAQAALDPIPSQGGISNGGEQ